MPYGIPNDPDISGNPYTPAEQEAVRRLNEARIRNREIANAIGIDPHVNSGIIREALSAPAAPTYSTPLSPSVSTSGYSPGSSGGSGGGGGYSYSYGGGYGGGGGGGGGMSLADQQQAAQRSIDFMKQLLGSDAFTAQPIRPDPTLMQNVRRAGRRDMRTARREYGQLDRLLRNTADNPYRQTNVARAPGREGRQSSAAFRNVLRILGADTREANQSRRVEGRLARNDALGELRSGRNAFLSGLRMQAWQAQQAQQQQMTQARLALLAQMAALYGQTGKDFEMPDLSQYLGGIAPPATPTPGGTNKKLGQGKLPVGGGDFSVGPRNPTARNRRRVGQGGLA